MYFVNELHEANFRKLLHWNYSFTEALAWVLPMPRFQSSLYIAAHPVIYVSCYKNWGNLRELRDCPLLRIYQPGREFDLSGSYLQLARAGIRLYRDYKKTTPSAGWSKEITLTFEQACKIRDGDYDTLIEVSSFYTLQ